jgi:hypothetical protein
MVHVSVFLQLLEQYNQAQSDISKLSSARSQLASDLEALQQQKEAEQLELTAQLEALSQELVNIKQVKVCCCLLLKHEARTAADCCALYVIMTRSSGTLSCRSSLRQSCARDHNLLCRCRLSWRRATLARMQRSNCCRTHLLWLMRPTRRCRWGLMDARNSPCAGPAWMRDDECWRMLDALHAPLQDVIACGCPSAVQCSAVLAANLQA